jgi:hypothetical protein
MEQREVFAVIGNTDCTEGRGSHFIKAYCETSGTAQRLGYKGYVQGGAGLSEDQIKLLQRNA